MALGLSVLVIAIMVRDALGNVSNVSSATPSVWTEPFVDGAGGWKIYRIPSLVVTASGDLLLFVEGLFKRQLSNDRNANRNTLSAIVEFCVRFFKYCFSA